MRPAQRDGAENSVCLHQSHFFSRFHQRKNVRYSGCGWSPFLELRFGEAKKFRYSGCGWGPSLELRFGEALVAELEQSKENEQRFREQMEEHVMRRAPEPAPGTA